MSKLAIKDDGINKQFEPQIYQSKRRGQSRNFYEKCNYDWRNYQNRYRSNSGRIQYGQNYRSGPRYGQGYRNDFRRGNFGGNVRTYQIQNFRGQNNRGGYRGNYRNENYESERGRSRSRERSYSDDRRRRDRNSSNSRSRSGSKASTDRDKIRCYKCKEYDHFTKDCPTTKEERKVEQIQWMFNFDEEQTSLKTLAISDT